MPNTSSWRASQRVKEPPRSIQCYSNKFHAPNSPHPVLRHELHPRQPPRDSFCAKNPRWSPWFPPSARKISPRGAHLYSKKAASWGWSKTRVVKGGEPKTKGVAMYSVSSPLFATSPLLLSFCFPFPSSSFFCFFFFLRGSRLTSSPHVKITGLTVSRAEANRGVTAVVS